MALMYHPKAGAILVCDYCTGFVPPEMVKARPVVVVSPRLRHRNDLCTVVPLSTTAPDPVEDYHCSIMLPRPLPKPFDTLPMWAKCDMLSTVSFKRLNLISIGRRQYITPAVGDNNLEQIKRCILYALGMGLEIGNIERRLMNLFSLDPT